MALFNFNFGETDADRARALAEQNQAESRRLIEPLVAADQSADPIAFLRSFAGAAGQPALQEGVAGGLASGDPTRTAAAQSFSGALQQITPEGQRETSRINKRAGFMEQFIYEDALRANLTKAREFETGALLAGFDNPQAYAAAVMPIEQARIGWRAGGELLDLLQTDDEGTLFMPSEARGAAKVKFVRVIRGMAEVLGSGKLTLGETELLRGLITDITAWSQGAKWQSQTAGELKEFQRIMEDQIGAAQSAFPTLARDRPDLFGPVQPRTAPGLPAGFTPR